MRTSNDVQEIGTKLACLGVWDMWLGQEYFKCGMYGTQPVEWAMYTQIRCGCELVDSRVQGQQRGMLHARAVNSQADPSSLRVTTVIT